MGKVTRPVPAFNGVVEGSVATCNLPIGRSYHSITLTRGGTAFTHDHMTKIVIKANGVPIWETTGSDLDDMQVHDGLAAGSATISEINFERAGLLNRSWVEATKIGTGMPLQPNPNLPNYNPEPITSLTLEITLTGTTAPTLSAVAETSDPDVTGGIIKRRKFPGYAPGAAGVFEISDLPRGDLINRIWIHAASDEVDSVEFTRDNVTEFDRTEAINEYKQSNGVKAPVANWFVIDPTEKGNGNQSIETDGLNDMRLKLTMGGADTLTVYVDYIGDLSGN